jgi:hypothetical protein
VGRPPPVRGISRCCKSHSPALVYSPSCEDEPSGGLRGQLLVLAMNFVIVRSLEGEPLERAAPSIGRAFGPNRPAFKTNLIPQSDSRQTTEVTTEGRSGSPSRPAARMVYLTLRSFCFTKRTPCAVRSGVIYYACEDAAFVLFCFRFAAG